MRKRDYRVTLYLDRDEKEMLRRNAKACGMDDNSYLRQLLTGHEPRQAPDDRFWETMDQRVLRQDRSGRHERRQLGQHDRGHERSQEVASVPECDREGVSETEEER